MEYIWFGNDEKQMWVPCPRTGLKKQVNRRAETLEFENGGMDVVYSAPGATTYDFDIGLGDPATMSGIDAYGRFANLEWGRSYIRFVDPVYQGTNLLNLSWANPSLIEQGARSFGATAGSPGTVTFAAATSPTLDRPTRNALFTFSNPGGNVLNSQGFTLLVPPNYTAHIVASGTNTGTGRLAIFNSAGTYVSAITPTATNAAYGTPNTVAGGGSGTKFTIGLTSALASDTHIITLNSIMVQILPTGTSPDFSRFYPGGGHSGLRFDGPAPTVQTYIMQDKVGLSGVRLVEVETWQR